MKDSRLVMGMPITVEIVDRQALPSDIDDIFDYFHYVDELFSTYKEDSEISRLNRGELSLGSASRDVQIIFALAEQTKQATQGYFDIWHGDHYDPSGLVKGWAIFKANQLLAQKGFRNFRVDAGGDMHLSGANSHGVEWRIGIRNPLHPDQIVKVVKLKNCGIATSGTYLRGQHIYDPHQRQKELSDIVSLTVIGPNVYEADRFATAAFAMGGEGISFIEHLSGFEGYQIDGHGRATLTSGFNNYVSHQ